MFSMAFFKSYRLVCQALSARHDHPMLAHPVRHWARPGERHLSEFILGLPVKVIVNSYNYDLFFQMTLKQRQELVAILGRVERQLTPVSTTEAIAGPPPAGETIRSRALGPLAEKYEDVRTAIRSRGAHPLLRQPLAIWAQPSDHHLSGTLLGQNLEEVLALSFEELSKRRGIGVRKIEYLLEVLARVREDMVEEISVGGDTPAGSAGGGTTECIAPADSMAVGTQATRLPADPDEITEASWRFCAELIARHGLENEPLGRLVPSLDDLPTHLWRHPVSTYTAISVWELQDTRGTGAMKFRQIVGAVLRLARLLESMTPHEALSARVLPAALAPVLAWIEQVLVRRDVPDLPSLSTQLVEPLLHQVELDLGATTASFVRRRLGGLGPRDILEAIARDHGLSRERVRQIIAKTPKMWALRCPEAKHAIYHLYDFLRESSPIEDPAQLVRRVLETLFDVSWTRPQPTARTNLLTAWSQAGNQKITPLSQDEFKLWLAREGPDLNRAEAMRQLAEHGLTATDDEGQTWFFSPQPLDRLLCRLFATEEPLPLAEAAQLLGEKERNLQSKLATDPRFIEDEFHRLWAANRKGCFRRAGAWHLRLGPSPHRDAKVRADAVSLDRLIPLVSSGLLTLGIADAPIQGVHRFANEMLERIHGAPLAGSITPLVLASMLVNCSHGLIRHMRRFRLRWDPAGSSLAARGKPGWVEQVVSQAGVPMLLAELRAALNRHYQDTPRVSVQDPMLDSTREEGTSTGPVQFVLGSGRIPTVIIPRDWKLDLERVNVSQGIQQLVAAIVRTRSKNAYRRRDFARLPWLLELVEHQTHEPVRWTDDPPTEDEASTIDLAARIGRRRGPEDPRPRTSPAPSENPRPG